MLVFFERNYSFSTSDNVLGDVASEERTVVSFIGITVKLKGERLVP